jgi:hypothetical protein
VLRLFYVDESRDRGQRGHHYFVGLLADGDAVARAEAALEKIAEKAWDDGLARWGTELHAAEIFNGTKAWQRGSIQQRIDLLEATLSVIGDEGVEVIARGANMQRFAKDYPGADPYRWEFSNLLERLNERLRTPGDYGLVISDQQTAHRERASSATLRTASSSAPAATAARSLSASSTPPTSSTPSSVA